MYPEVASWKILIIDDDQDNLGVSQQFLSFLGAEVRTAKNGRQGLEALEAFIPTVILLDLSMPVMDGWEVIKLIRAHEQRKELPVLALTAHAMRDDKARVLEAGFDSYVTKPYLLPELLSSIMACLDKKREGIIEEHTEVSATHPSVEEAYEPK